MTEPTWECPTCGKVTWPFLHSCSGAWQPHPFVYADPTSPHSRSNPESEEQP